jgi:hypothetical protein
MANTSRWVRREELPNPKLLRGAIKLSGTLPNDAYIIGVPKNIHQDRSLVQAGASLVVLHTFTLPAGSLKADNDFLDIIYAGGFAANNNTKNITLRANGNVVHSFGLFPINSAGWTYYVRYIRVSATSIVTVSMNIAGVINRDAATAAMSGSGTHFQLIGNVGTTVQNLNTNNNVIDVQGQGTAANDVSQSYSSIAITRF